MRSASKAASTPSVPSSQPPFGTESRWPPMMTGAVRFAAQRGPAVAGRIDRRLEAERRQLVAEPGARVAPDRSPREPLRTVGGRRAGRELPEIGDDVPGAHDWADYRVPLGWGSRAARNPAYAATAKLSRAASSDS